jgi:hypothetical protein
MNAATIKATPVLTVAAGSGVIGAFYVTLDAIGPGSFYPVLNQFGPAVLLGICLWAAYRLVREQPLALWSPIPWFFIACAAYFGFGPLAYYFATPESVEFMDAFHEVDDYALLRTNLLNVVGIGSVCVGILFGRTLSARRSWTPEAAHSLSVVKRALIVFLVVGGTVKYLLTLPFALGLLSWTLPGAIQHLSSLIGGAIILLFALVHRGETRFRWILYPLIASELVTGLMTFSKQDVLWTVITVVLGWYLGRPRLRVLVMSAVGIVLVYAVFLSPFVSFARIAVGVLGTDSPQELSRSLQEYKDVDKDQVSAIMPDVQGWWTRFAYANAQSFAMQEHDRGEPGSTIGLILYAFVPRLLYPEKPIMTSGRDFTALVTGSDSSSSAPGIFGEAYWNGGWPLLIAAGIYVGLVFAVFGAFSMRKIAAGQYVYAPVVMAGIVMGFRPDDWFVPTYVGALVEVFVLYGLLRFLFIPLITTPPKGTKPGEKPSTTSSASEGLL